MLISAHAAGKLGLQAKAEHYIALIGAVILFFGAKALNLAVDRIEFRLRKNILN